MSEIDYLKSYYPFDDEVMAKIEEVAHDQQGLTWPEYARQKTIPELKKFNPKQGKAIEILDICPTDYASVQVYHMPMGCLLDANTILHVVTLAEASPDTRVVSVSNPGQPGSGSGKLGPAGIVKVWNGDLRPVVGPTLEYLHTEAIERANHAGASYGAEKTAASAQHAEQYDHMVPWAVMIEPTAVSDGRGLIGTGRAFMSTGKHAKAYGDRVVELAGSGVFKSAQLHKKSELGYGLGIVGRLSNIAIGKAMGRAGFEGRINQAMAASSEMKSTISWGTDSELAINGLVLAITDKLRARYGQGRVKTMILEGQTHAINVDPLLNAALILQGNKDIK